MRPLNRWRARRAGSERSAGICSCAPAWRWRGWRRRYWARRLNLPRPFACTERLRKSRLVWQFWKVVPTIGLDARILTEIAMSNEMSVANVSECPTVGDSLNEKQLAAIDLLSCGKSYTAVAKSIDVDRRTIYRWRQNPEFAGTLEERRLELW